MKTKSTTVAFILSSLPFFFLALSFSPVLISFAGLIFELIGCKKACFLALFCPDGCKIQTIWLSNNRLDMNAEPFGPYMISILEIQVSRYFRATYISCLLLLLFFILFQMRHPRWQYLVANFLWHENLRRVIWWKKSSFQKQPRSFHQIFKFPNFWRHRSGFILLVLTIWFKSQSL